MRGTETSVPSMGNKHPADLPSIEEVLDRENMFSALERVQKNKGAPGIDDMTVETLPRYLVSHWPRIKAELISGSYKPAPVRRVEIPKPDGGVRLLGIPTVLDRLIQQALMQVLQKHWDSSFSPHSHGFRPGRGTHGAIKEAKEYIQSGHTVVVDIDLEKFFDRVNHDVLMGLVMKRLEDKHIITLIRSYLNAGVLLGELVSPTEEGVPQGGPLSPLLSNLMLNELDAELMRRNLHFVRYADDCNIYVRSMRAGQRVRASVTRFLAKKLKLTVNEEKSAVDRPSRRTFLGFSFVSDGRIRIAPKSIKRLKSGYGKQPSTPKGEVSKKPSNRSQCTFARGTDTSVLMRRNRREKNSMNGYDVVSAALRGSNGRRLRGGMTCCENLAVPTLWQKRPPVVAVAMAIGACPTTPA